MPQRLLAILSLIVFSLLPVVSVADNVPATARAVWSNWPLDHCVNTQYGSWPTPSEFCAWYYPGGVATPVDAAGLGWVCRFNGLVIAASANCAINWYRWECPPGYTMLEGDPYARSPRPSCSRADGICELR